MLLLVMALNFALALLMWLILGRAALGLLTGGRGGAVQQLFDRVTLPLFALTRRALPFVGARGAPLATLLLLAALRVALIVATRPSPPR